MSVLVYSVCLRVYVSVCVCDVLVVRKNTFVYIMCSLKAAGGCQKLLFFKHHRACSIKNNYCHCFFDLYHDCQISLIGIGL